MNQNFFHVTFVVVFAAFTIIRMVYHAKATRERGEAEYKSVPA